MKTILINPADLFSNPQNERAQVSSETIDAMARNIANHGVMPLPHANIAPVVVTVDGVEVEVEDVIEIFDGRMRVLAQLQLHGVATVQDRKTGEDIKVKFGKNNNIVRA